MIAKPSPQICLRYGNGLIDVSDPYFQQLLMYSERRGFLMTSEHPFISVAFAVVFIFTITAFSVMLVAFAPLGLQYGFHPAFMALSLLALSGFWIYKLFNILHKRMLNDSLPPTQQVVLSADGIRSVGILYLRLTKCFFPWDTISSVSIVDAPYNESGRFPTPYVSTNYFGKVRLEPCVEFRNHKNRKMRLRLSCLRSVEERRVLVEMVKKHVRREVQKDDLSRILRANQIQDLPFTQLWSNALRSDRPRLNTEPLAEASLLQDGRFLVKEQIGGGGQGIIYLAEMLEGAELAVPVAIKEYVLPDVEHVVDRKRAIEQFEREVHLLAKVKHDGVVQMLDAFVEDQRAYLVMQYIEGQTLRDKVKQEGALSEREICRLALEICDTLQYLHTLKPEVVHLDVTPENILLDRNGRVKLIDFNTSSDGSGLRTKLIAGKQRYMSPEQFRNEVSCLCDIYALGCTLFFLAAGVEPEPLTKCDIKSVRADVSDWLNDLVAKATELDKSRRFQNMAEILTLLKAKSSS